MGHSYSCQTLPVVLVLENLILVPLRMGVHATLKKGLIEILLELHASFHIPRRRKEGNEFDDESIVV